VYTEVEGIATCMRYRSPNYVSTLTVEVETFVIIAIVASNCYLINFYLPVKALKRKIPKAWSGSIIIRPG